MSVVAWDGQTVAADRQGTMSDLAIVATKLRRAKDGNILAVTGGLELGAILMDWYNDGENPEEWPLELQQTDDHACDLILITPDAAYMYGRLGYRCPIENSFMAWGSGASLALGAMAAGAKAADAVQIASTFNIYCGQGIDILKPNDK